MDRDALRPLAERIRPRTLDDMVGQRRLLAPGTALRQSIETGHAHSMILWGPPGCGKTTLALLLAQYTDAEFKAISAVLAGLPEVRVVLAEAAHRFAEGRRTVLFVDEVHRFNKNQQDAFLPHIERGTILFVGATTENPSFEVNSALLSRATVFVLEPLDDGDLAQLLDRAQAAVNGPTLDAEARTQLIHFADGDGRRLLNAYESAAVAHKGVQHLGLAQLEAAIGRMMRRGDKGGDVFYDLISALHKSVRGSNPDAALYWLARMLDAGMDPRYAARRLVRMASEDIGLADPRALRMTLDAAEVFARLGSPEGELAIAQAVVYLAVAPKSNAVYKAWNEVRALVQKDGTRPVPVHLRNAPTRLMKDIGLGQGYRYAHNEEGGFAAGETYLPPGLVQTRFYEPVPRGLEQRIHDRLTELRRLDEEADKPS